MEPLGLPVMAIGGTAGAARPGPASVRERVRCPSGPVGALGLVPVAAVAGLVRT